MPIKRFTEDSSDASENPTELGQAPEVPTELIDSAEGVQAPTDVGPTAWAEVGDDSLDASSNLDDRRPLSVALMALLVSVVIGGIALGAYVVGERVHVRVQPARASVQPSNPSSAAPTPTTTVAPAPALKIQPNAWEAFTYLLRARGLSINPAEKDYDDKANRHLCWTLFSNGDPAFRAKMIQGSIEASEGGTWGKPEATYAIRSAIMAYCPQFDR